MIGATILVSAGVLLFSRSASASMSPLAVLLAALLLIATVGAIADKHPIAAAPRLVLQSFAVASVLTTFPPELRVLPVLSWWNERVFLFIGALWFVNLVNFMDGLDWMTVVEVVPITGALAAIGLVDLLSWQDVVMSLALCGATIGFAFFKRPVAKLFLGDVGSLPIGLLLGWLLIVLAGSGGRTAAVLLPLYYLADSTITLLRRAVRGEPIWRAHRTHFYQCATERGFSVGEVVARVFILNLCLCSLAFATVLLPGKPSVIAALTVGAALVVWTLATFAQGKQANSSSS